MQLCFYILYAFSVIFVVSVGFFIQFYTNKVFVVNQAYSISIGAYFYMFCTNYANLSLYISIPLAIFFCILQTLILEFLIYDKMRKKNNPSFAFLVASLGLYTICQNFISVFFGDDTKSLNTVEITVDNQFFGVYITMVQIITIVVAGLVFVGMYLLYNFTSLGKQIRAVSENAELAGIYGISSNKIILIATAISSALAAIAGILYAYDTNLTPTMGFNLLLYGVVAMIIGGVGSFRGLLLGSLLVATSQNLVAYYLDTKWMDAVVYVILIVFLLWKPLGFSGKRLKKIEI